MPTTVNERRQAGAAQANGPAAAAAVAGAVAAQPPVAAALAARLGVSIGDDRFLVELSEAGEIVPVPASILPVPLARDWLIGLTNFRGSLFTVVDLRRFAVGQFTEAGKESRIVALSPALDFNVTLLVTRMLGLRNTATMKPADPGPARSEGSLAARTDLAWLGQSHVDAEGQIWRELSLSRLIRDPAFLLIGKHTA